MGPEIGVGVVGDTEWERSGYGAGTERVSPPGQVMGGRQVLTRPLVLAMILTRTDKDDG